MKRMKTLVPRVQKKEAGFTSVVSCLFLVVIVVILITFTFQNKMISMTKANLDDGLTASVLAGLIFDAREYAKTGNIVINTTKSYKAFIECIKNNLDLDNDYNSINDVYYDSAKIRHYVIYNVYGTEVVRTEFVEGTPETIRYPGGMGTVRNEKGSIIEKSGIYVELEIQIKGIWGSDSQAVSTDIFMTLEER